MKKTSECIFCKIINYKEDAVKIWEDKDFIAILDVFPNTEGMTLVIPKKHYDSDIFSLDDSKYCKLLIASKKVAKILEKGLGVKRVAMVAEGMGVNHLHIKLYPLYGLKDKFEEMWSKDKVYFEKYKGYLSTQIGPKKDKEELNKIANKIKWGLKNA